MAKKHEKMRNLLVQDLSRKEKVRKEFKGPLTEDVELALKRGQGILLDIGCGNKKRGNFVGMDMYPWEGVDIVWDFEKFPWPLPDECCLTVICIHVWEHIKPWHTIDFMNEVWRITKHQGQFALAMPYGVSSGYLQDPTHCNPCNEATFDYFDPRNPLLYSVYQPKPWLMDPGFPVFQSTGDMEVLMVKITEDERDIIKRTQDNQDPHDSGEEEAE